MSAIRELSVRAKWRLAGVVLLSLAILTVNAASLWAQDRCGGTERWFVKTGIDPDANLVDATNRISITVAQLNALPQRRNAVPAGNNKFRLPEERVVYEIHGRLVKFKNEDDDKDYHLVITDDSLQYTPGGSGTTGQETGTSFIAEIPRLDCIAGKQGSLSATSAFQSSLEATRNKFEVRFPNGKGADKDLGGIRVTLVGVAFYDRQHNQTGRSVNGIELHPLLDITFEDAGGSTPVTLTELLTNQGFENGSAGWSGTISDIDTYPQQPAHGGSKIAWLNGYGHATTETLAQRVSIPGNATRAQLSLWLHIETEETTTSKKYDTLTIQVRSSSGVVLKNLGSYSNLDDTLDFVQKSFNLDQFIGQQIEIYLKGTEDAEKATSFAVDDFSLSIE